jgi:transposase-like protein
LSIPELRNGSFSSELFKRIQRSEQALVLSLIERAVSEVSICKVNTIVEELCGTEFPKSTVSHLYKKLDPLVEAWNGRDLSGQEYPFVLVDALAIKVRSNKRKKPNGYKKILPVSSIGMRQKLTTIVPKIVTAIPEDFRRSLFQAFQGQIKPSGENIFCQ